MKKILLFLICFISLSAEVIQNDLFEKMSKNPNEKFHILVIMKDQFSIEQIREEQKLYNNDSETIQMLIDNLKQKTEESQSIYNFLQTRDIEELHFFWIINAISLVADSGTIQDLARYSEIESIVLSEEKTYLTPDNASKSASGAWGISYIHADEAQAMGVTGKGVTVAVIDSGVDLDHPDFAYGQILVKKAWHSKSNTTANDVNGHGTHVAGIIGSEKYGVAPECNILPVKALKDNGNARADEIIEGIEYAIQNADVLNMSFSGPAEFIESSDPSTRHFMELLHSTIQKAVSLNKICVVAAGNEGKIGSPGINPDAITVGAIDSNGTLAHFSGCGPAFHYNVDKPEVVAPGVDITSTWNDGATNIESGTSQATPHVSGVVALMLSINKSLTPEQVKNILQDTAFGTKEKNTYGAGCVDAVAAINAIPEAPLPDQPGRHCGMIGLEFMIFFLACSLLKRKI